MSDDLRDLIASEHNRHRPVVGQSIALLFPVACECGATVPGWAAWDKHIADAVLPLVREAQAEAWARGVEDLAAVFKGPIGAPRELNNPYRETP